MASAVSHPSPSIARSERTGLVEAARAVHDEGLVVGSVGNLSLRVGEAILITPTRLPYWRLDVDDLVTVGIDGNRIDGFRQASLELKLHLAIYRCRTDVGAVVHTHSPHATAWSYLGLPLLPVTEENEYYGVGPVSTSPPAPSGSEQMARGCARTLGSSAAVLLGRHGVIATASDLDRALDVARVVERQAQIAWLLRQSPSKPTVG